jgi:hypothetical protein
MPEVHVKKSRKIFSLHPGNSGIKGAADFLSNPINTIQAEIPPKVPILFLSNL